MSTKTAFAMLALLAWMMTFCVIVLSALRANCFFLHDTYQQRLLIFALINMVCVVWLICIPVWQATKGSD
ncbi:hypothetical protein [Alishewanella phage vB_AspM_Slickus01]|nr:hypothetical protein [Alishewanella phage vB_AspM_Slickus01]